MKLFLLAPFTLLMATPAATQGFPPLRYSFTGTVNDGRNAGSRPVSLSGYFDVDQRDINTNQELKDSGLYGSYAITAYSFQMGDLVIAGDNTLPSVSPLNNAYFDSYSTSTPYPTFGFVVAYYDDYDPTILGLERIEVNGAISLDSSKKNNGDLPLIFDFPAPSDGFSVDVIAGNGIRNRIFDGFSYLDDQVGSPVFENFSVAIAPVPEPSTWMMLVLGFGVIGYAMRRKTVLRYV